MRYLDICSGISAPTMAWKPLGWQALCFAEIEAAPRAVLSHHYPAVPLRGDFTEIRGDEYGPVDLLVGGTPCQSFSVAGLRGGLADARGNLALEFLRLAGRARPRWVVWENVPGVFSSLSHDAPDLRPPEIDLDAGDGPADGEEVVVEDSYDSDESHAFACFLAGLSDLGYGVAYRVLDAQYAGVPQRRRRVFVVGYLGDWRRAAAVLFERHSLSGHPAPRREKGQEIARPLAAGSERGSGYRNDADTADNLVAYGGNNTAGPIDVSTAINSHGGPRGRLDFESETFIAHSLRAEGFDASEDGTGRGTPLVPVPFDTTDYESGAFEAVDQAGPLTTSADRTRAAPICFSAKDHGADASDISPTLWAGGHSGSHANAGVMPAVAFNITPSNSNKDFNARQSERAQALTAGGNRPSARGGDLIAASAVRRLTPRECERLQGFPDDFTLVPYRGKPMADGPRYKMLGNSMAVPVLSWLGQRIAAVEAIRAEAKAA